MKFLICLVLLISLLNQSHQLPTDIDWEKLQQIELMPEAKQLKQAIQNKSTTPEKMTKGFFSSITNVFKPVNSVVGAIAKPIINPIVKPISNVVQPIFKPIVKPIISKLPGGFVSGMIKDCLNDVTLCAASYAAGQYLGPQVSSQLFISNVYGKRSIEDNMIQFN